MKHEKLNLAMDQISDRHIAEAATRKKRLLPWLGTIAAVLAIALTISTFGQPTVRAKAVATASEARKSQRPDRDKFRSYEDYEPYINAYLSERDSREAISDEAVTTLRDFFAESSQIFLDSDTENRIWSPVNGYIALAMLAEVTDGTSRQQILDTLNTSDLDTLRTQVSALWEQIYQDDGKEIAVLANSLWLDDRLSYTQETMDTLAYHHYASVYQGALDSEKTANALKTWINNNTGSFLKDAVADLDLTPEPVDGFPDPQLALILASTVYLKAQWYDDFSKSQNTDGAFKTPTGKVICTYMNKKEYETNYYWGESFGAVQMNLKNGCQMWLFLPDEDKTVSDVLEEGEYLSLPSKHGEAGFENSKYMKVNLSVPKFDVSSQADLKAGLQQLGITEVFSPTDADFSAIMGTDSMPVWADSVKQAARVAIDEDGLTAASYIVIPGAGAGAPPDEVIDFKLDRPFVFMITSGNIPIFTGVVNQP